MKTPSEKVTATKVLEVKGLLATNLFHQHQVAAITKLNQGRISEIKNGLYDWKLPNSGSQQNLF